MSNFDCRPTNCLFSKLFDLYTVFSGFPKWDRDLRFNFIRSGSVFGGRVRNIRTSHPRPRNDVAISRDNIAFDKTCFITGSAASDTGFLLITRRVCHIFLLLIRRKVFEFYNLINGFLFFFCVVHSSHSVQYTKETSE